MADSDDRTSEDPTPPDTRAAQLPDDPEDEIFPPPEEAIEVTPPIDVVTVDHAEPGVEPPQVYPQANAAAGSTPGGSGGSAGAEQPAEPQAAELQAAELQAAEPQPAEPAPPEPVPAEPAPPGDLPPVRRLRVHGLFRLPDLAAMNTGVARTKKQFSRTLTDVYHDTDDLRLARWDATLTRREGGDDEGWHLDLPVGASAGQREHIQLPVADGEAGEVPAELAELVLALARNADLRAVAALQVQRTPYLLYDSTGREFAEVIDDTLSVLDGEHIAARFRELEVRALVDDADLDPIIEAFGAAGAVPGSVPTTVTVLGPVILEPADVPEPQIVGPQDPAGAAVTAHIRRHARALLLQDVRVRRDLPDSVHQMRVAARRLRSGLKVFEPMLDVEWAEALRAELGWVAGELGVSRDTEVLQERLDHHADEVGEDYARLIRAVVDPALSTQWHDARDHALRAMASQRYRSFLDQLVDAAQHPRLNESALAPAEDVLPGFVNKAWKKLSKEVSLLRIDGPSDVWHEARIRAKKARYAAEAVAPVMGEQVKRFAKALSAVTELLGEHQDAWVAQETLKEMAAAPGVDGLTGFSLGLLYEFEIDQEMFARKEFTEIWKGVKRSHKKARLG